MTGQLLQIYAESLYNFLSLQGFLLLFLSDNEPIKSKTVSTKKRCVWVSNQKVHFVML